MSAYLMPGYLMHGRPQSSDRKFESAWRQRIWGGWREACFRQPCLTAVKEYSRMMNMSCLFSLHCITTVTLL